MTCHVSRLCASTSPEENDIATAAAGELILGESGGQTLLDSLNWASQDGCGHDKSSEGLHGEIYWD